MSTDLIHRLRVSADEWLPTSDHTLRAHKLLDEAANALERLERIVDVQRHQVALERARMENAVTLLTGIHSLLYPAPITTPDGRTLVFRPEDPDPHDVLQELSDRIRALPEKLAALQPAG